MILSCSICHELMKEDQNISATRCGHMFHEHCLEPWRNALDPSSQGCPQCREPLPAESIFRVWPTAHNRADIVGGEDEAALLRGLQDTIDTVETGLLFGRSLITKLQDNAESIQVSMAFRDMEIINQTNEKYRLKHENDALKTEIESLKRDLSSAKENLSIHNSTIQDLLREQEDSNSRKRDQDELMWLEQSTQDMISELSSTKNELSSAQRYITDLEQQVDGANKKIVKLKEENQAIRRRSEKFTRAVLSCARSRSLEPSTHVCYDFSEVMALQFIHRLKDQDNNQDNSLRISNSKLSKEIVALNCKIKQQREKEIAQANSLAELRYQLEQQKTENDHHADLNTVYESQLKLYESMLEEKEGTSNIAEKIEATPMENAAVAEKVEIATAAGITAPVETTNAPLNAPVEVTTVNTPPRMQTSPILMTKIPAEIHTVASKEANVPAPVKKITTPVETITAPQETVNTPVGTISAPQETITVPGEIISAAQETITVPGEIISAAQETITVPGEIISAAQATVNTPVGTISAPQETITVPVKTMVLARKSSVPETTPNYVRSPVPTPRRSRICTGSTSSNADPNDNDKESSASPFLPIKNC